MIATGNANRHWAKINATSVTEDEAVAIARRFEVVVAPQATLGEHLVAMRAANPAVDVLVYRNGTASRPGQRYAEALYSHDAGGRRITLPDGGLLMNPGEAAWARVVADDCAGRLADTGYDGCYVDVLGVAPLNTTYSSATPINPTTSKPWTPAQWLAATSRIGEAVKVRTGRYVLVNGLQNGRRYADPAGASAVLLAAVDGGNAEDFSRIARADVDHYRKEPAWRADVEMLVDAGARGRSVFAMTKVWVPATADQVDALHEYALASFLLGTDGSSFFTFYSDVDRMNTTEAITPDRFDGVDIGMPTGPYARLGGAYGRWFTRGGVVVNPWPAAVVVTLPMALTDLAGEVFTTLTVAPHTGRILLAP